MPRWSSWRTRTRTSVGYGDGPPQDVSSRRPVSDTLSDEQAVDAIARADYTQPEGRERPTAPPDGPPLQREGGLFRRFREGFRYDSEA